MSVSVIRSFSICYWSFLHFFSLHLWSSKMQNVATQKSDAQKSHLSCPSLQGQIATHGYQFNLLLVHSIKISDICRKMVFGHLVLHSHEERMFGQLGQLVKTKIGVRVHRQTLPVLSQTGTAIFSLGMTTCYENVEMNITQFREWDFSPPETTFDLLHREH